MYFFNFTLVRIIGIILFGFLSGCSNTHTNDDLAMHKGHPYVVSNSIIQSDKDGHLIDPEKHKLFSSQTEIDHYFSKILTVSDNENARKNPNKPRKILIFVHGGLNTANSAYSHAENIYQNLEKEQQAGWSYPLFFVWPSGPVSTYGEHLFKIRRGEINRTLAIPSSPIVLIEDVLQSVIRTPITWTHQFKIDYQAMAYHAGLLPKPENLSYAKTGCIKAKQAGVDVAVSSYKSPLFEPTYRFGKYFLTLPLRLTSSALILDRPAKEAWDIMLRRTQNVFISPYEHRDEKKLLGCKKDCGAFSQFAKALIKHIAIEKAQDPNISYEITLVGHSMGTIVLNQFIQKFGNDLPQIKRIIYMAAANSIKDFQNSVLPYIQSANQMAQTRGKSGVNFYNLTLNHVSEVAEDEYVFIPKGSLLEWIDAWYTNPNTFLEKTMGKELNIHRALNLFYNQDPNSPLSQNVKKYVHFKSFSRKNDSIPKIHGDFSIAPFWRAEFYNTGNLPGTRSAPYYPVDWK